MKLTIKTDVTKALLAFRKAPDAMSRELRVEMKDQMTDVQTAARARHRFTTRSGMAERSVQVNVNNSGTVGEVELDRGIAIYAPRLHEGWGSWAPDEFLHSAFDAQKDKITAGLEKAIRRGIRKAGLQ